MEFSKEGMCIENIINNLEQLEINTERSPTITLFSLVVLSGKR